MTDAKKPLAHPLLALPTADGGCEFFRLATKKDGSLVTTKTGNLVARVRVPDGKPGEDGKQAYKTTKIAFIGPEYLNIKAVSQNDAGEDVIAEANLAMLFGNHKKDGSFFFTNKSEGAKFSKANIVGPRQDEIMAQLASVKEKHDAERAAAAAKAPANEAPAEQPAKRRAKP